MDKQTILDKFEKFLEENHLDKVKKEIEEAEDRAISYYPNSKPKYLLNGFLTNVWLSGCRAGVEATRYLRECEKLPLQVLRNKVEEKFLRGIF